MSDKNNIIEEYFTWDERSLIELPKKSDHNGNCVVEDTTKDIVRECVERNEFVTIRRKKTEKEVRSLEYRRRKYKKRHERKLLKSNGCDSVDEYREKKLHGKQRSRERRRKERREYKVRYRRIHYFKHTSKVHNKRCKIGYKIKPFDLWKIFKRQNMRCVLTGRKLTRDTISLDHIIPISRGGTNNLDNLRFVHIHANLFKLDMNDGDLLQLAKDIVNTML
jgi:hypothetical protein